MAERIELPDFEALVDNQVYARRVSMEKDKLGYEPSRASTQILLFGRHYIPTDDEVVGYIVEAVQRASRNGPGSGATHLEQALSMAPNEMLASINSWEKETIEHLYKHCAVETSISGMEYLQLKSGICPDFALETVKEGLKKHPEADALKSYGKAISYPGFESWEVLVRLENGLIPSEPTIDTLIGFGVTGSDVLEVNGRYGNYNLVMAQTKEILSAFDSREAISKIKDVTGDINSHLAGLTLIAFVNCIIEERGEERKSRTDKSQQEPIPGHFFIHGNETKN